ncbi:MAG TPA: DUF4058 family protein, partial [Isosphaeraceae bacterium]
RGLPRPYDARIEERLTVVTHEGEEMPYRADVLVTGGRPTSPGSSEARAAGATAMPVTIPYAAIAETIVERWIEVRRQPGRALVAVIELLSPSNKVGDGRPEYLRKREELIRQSVHLVELDFLLRGRRLPMASPLPPGDAFALVGRADRRDDCEVYGWSIREAPPTIPVPLDAPDPDVPLDLAAIYAAAHEEGEYERTVDRPRPLAVPLQPDDLAWAESLARVESPG